MKVRSNGVVNYVRKQQPPPQNQAPPIQQPQPTQPAPPINQQPPDDDNTPVLPSALTTLSGMSDDELAQLVRDSKKADMPNMLSDVDDQTQRFVYQAGLNEKPTVLEDSDFAQFLTDNNIPSRDILARSINPIQYTNASGTRISMSAQRLSDMMKYSRLNYIGGKVNGQAYGAGTYFDRNGGVNTGYGSTTVVAVLNPKTAKTIDVTTLQSRARAFAASHPKFARAAGAFNTRFNNNNMSIYALAMGYNVITDSKTNPSYHNVIDRSALVYRKSDS